MTTPEEPVKAKKKITPPDFDNPESVDNWVKEHIKEAGESFSDPGLDITPEERLKKQQDQAIGGVLGLKQLGTPDEKLWKVLKTFMPEDKPEDKKITDPE